MESYGLRLRTSLKIRELESRHNVTDFPKRLARRGGIETCGSDFRTHPACCLTLLRQAV